MRFNLAEISKGCAIGLLLTLNGLCMLTALCSLGFAVVDTRILQQYGAERAAGTFAGDMVVIAASLMLIGVAAFGCVGAVKENVKILYLYVGLLMIMVVVELMTAIFVGVQRCGLEFKVIDWLRDDFFKNVTHEDLAVRNRVWDELQTDYECCGLNGPADYTSLQQTISISCCPSAYRARTAHAQKQLYNNCVETASYYTLGCEDEILKALREDADWLLGVAVVSFWFEASGMVLAMLVASSLKNSVQVYKHTVKY